MIEGGQVRGEGHIQVIGNSVYAEPIPLPVKVVVACCCWHSRFRNNLGDGKTQRNIHRDSQGIFRHQQIYLVLVYKGIEIILEFTLNLRDLLGQ